MPCSNDDRHRTIGISNARRWGSWSAAIFEEWTPAIILMRCKLRCSIRTLYRNSWHYLSISGFISIFSTCILSEEFEAYEHPNWKGRLLRGRQCGSTAVGAVCCGYWSFTKAFLELAYHLTLRGPSRTAEQTLPGSNQRYFPSFGSFS